MQLYGLKNCDTCRKALKALPLAELIDVRAAGIPEEVMVQALETFGDALINTRSTTWRGLSESERNQSPKALLAVHPTLMKRPLIVNGDAMTIGWTKETQASYALS